jgi:hypothetical protein
VPGASVRRLIGISLADSPSSIGINDVGPRRPIP